MAWNRSPEETRVRIKSQKDFWSGLMFVAIGIAFAWGALNYNFGTSARPGPAYFPFGLGIILALLGALMLFAALTIEVAGGEPIGHWPIKPGLVILAAVALFGLLLPRLGMAATLPLLILVASVASGEFHWREVLINCVILTVGSWAVFIKGLGLTIPLWPALMGS
jgi:hypothetical protein